MQSLDVNRIMNGTHGQVWLDGEFVSEAYGLEAKVDIQKEEIPVTGRLGMDSKMMGYKGSGSIRLHKVNSRMAIKISDQIKQGINPRFQIISVLNDPAAYGAERVLIKDAAFNDLTLANWEVAQKGSVEAPFTFTDWDYLDKVTPRD